MALNENQKHFLDHAGLVALIGKIKAADATALKVATDILGLDADYLKTADYKTVKERLESLEGLTGTTSVAAQITAEIEKLDAEKSSTAAVDGTAAQAAQGTQGEEGYVAAQAAKASTQKVEVKVTEVDGKITAVDVTEKDIASQVVLDEEIARAKAAEKANADAIAVLNGTGDGSVSKAVNDAVTDLIDGAPDALDTLKEIADWIANQDESGVTDVASLVSRVDANTTAVGVKAVKAAEAVYFTQDEIDAAQEGDAAYGKTTADVKTAAVEAVAATGLYKYIDDAVSAANNSADDAIKALDATVSSDETTNFTAYKPAVGETAATPAAGADVKVAVTVKEVDGKLTAVSVATSDIASQALLDQEIAKRQEAIAALDATVGSTTVADGKHVAVQVVEADGVLTGVTVTEDDIASADALGKLQAVVGYSDFATGENAGQKANTIDARLEALEELTACTAADIANLFDNTNASGVYTEPAGE